MNHYYAVIMAGGGGTRLWPMSRTDRPKQLLPLIADPSMFRMSVSRLYPLFSADRIYVATERKYRDALRAQAPEIPEHNFIVEPYGRDSGPAAGLAVTVIHKRDPEAVVALLTADHHIAKNERFREVLSAAYEIAQEDFIVTLGIAPSYPATGFGYIRQGEELRQLGGFTCYHSHGFTEKPDEVTATDFVASGEYSWNSGMFIWKTSRALTEFKRQQPNMYNLLTHLQAAVDTPEFEDRLAEIWEKTPRKSIDFAIMEGAERMAVIPIDIGWSDVGTWASLFDVLKLDRFGNCFRGRMPERIILDTEHTLVFSDRLVVTIGVEDLVVVDTDDVLMICHKDRSQDVRQVVNHLKAIHKDEYL